MAPRTTARRPRSRRLPTLSHRGNKMCRIILHKRPKKQRPTKPGIRMRRSVPRSIVGLFLVGKEQILGMIRILKRCILLASCWGMVNSGTPMLPQIRPPEIALLLRELRRIR
nr:hypothetical protein Iba_scaffold27275CG0010 [Ipomoea batatas]